MKPLTRYDVQVKWISGRGWTTLIRGKFDSDFDTYAEAEKRWSDLVYPLPEFRG